MRDRLGKQKFDRFITGFDSFFRLKAGQFRTVHNQIGARMMDGQAFQVRQAKRVVFVEKHSRDFEHLQANEPVQKFDVV